MAAVYFLMRGINHRFEQTKKYLETMSFPLPMRVPMKDSMGITTMVDTQRIFQCSLRPIQLFEFVYPKEQQDVVLRTLGLPTNEPIIDEPRDKPQKSGSFISGKGIGLELAALRTMLGAKKIPPVNPEGPTKFIDKSFVNIMGIGIREDNEGLDALGNDHELI